MNTETEKRVEKDRILYRKGGIHSAEYTWIHNATRYERILKGMFFDALVWVTVKGERRLGRCQRTHMKFLSLHPITGEPIFECDVLSLQYPKRKDGSLNIVRMNSRVFNIELDTELPDDITWEQYEETISDNRPRLTCG
jgi:hypothetical protein